jgi:UTP-glucose-1-phosphate uridylyltransferase
MMSRSDNAIRKLSDKGMSLAAKPKYEVPALPRDITELGDEDLMDLFVMFTAWNDHLSGAVAVAAIEERQAQRATDMAEAKAMLANWKGGTGDRVAIAKAQIAVDPAVVALHEDLDEKHAFRKLVEVLAQNVERDSAVVSRELTRRTAGDNFKTRGRRFQA